MLSVSVRPIIWFCTYVFLKNASSMILVNGTPFSIRAAATRIVCGEVLLYWNTPESVTIPVYSASAHGSEIFSSSRSPNSTSQAELASGST